MLQSQSKMAGVVVRLKQETRLVTTEMALTMVVVVLMKRGPWRRFWSVTKLLSLHSHRCQQNTKMGILELQLDFISPEYEIVPLSFLRREGASLVVVMVVVLSFTSQSLHPAIKSTRIAGFVFEQALFEQKMGLLEVHKENGPSFVFMKWTPA
mmetsp:Transcript_19107/g.37833  ORF Transcript_19107/g.37833 Transcript_19107/m.37833 type:complete len:153 (+) Transcript_19107:728-1186(+)